MNYTVAVRALCEFTAKEGDLDLRFTPSPTGQEGIEGHGIVTARRPAGYLRELSLTGQYKTLTVRGRADGFDPSLQQLEEIKTYRGDLARQPANHRILHWAQAKIYGWLACQASDLKEIRVALVYFDIGSQRETVFVETHSAADLQAFFELQCERFIAWAEQEAAHRGARDAALTTLDFPHADFRPGQRELAEAVYKATSSARCLMAQAPTGIGKTIGTLYPMLKACPQQQVDKIFFLAAKTPGRGLALEAARLLRDSSRQQARQGGSPRLPLRVVEMVARDKACEFPENACHGDSCPLAKGFYDRLPAARQAAAEVEMLDKAAMREVALAHTICPYYLAQDMVRWTDVVVGDYNYYFDLSAMLPALTQLFGWRSAVLVDEAHNMVERARKMYSAELGQAGLSKLRKTVHPLLKKPLDRLARCWTAINKEHAEPYQVLPAAPENFLEALQKASSAITEFLAENPTHVDPVLQDFYFEALHFTRLAELFGDHSLFDITRTAYDAHRASSVFCIRNVIPAPFLKPRFAMAHATTMFSATLSPWHFYADMLGLPEDTVWVDVASPFAAAQLEVSIAKKISTRYQDRERSLAPVVGLMAHQYQRRPGNYLAFFSSYDYLQKVAVLFAASHPQIPMWEQSRRMEEHERDAFLARFVAGGQGIGFAVLGGAFAEGIDLPGERLIGAFIATLGLPQVNPVNEEMRRRMQDKFGDGYNYTYLYPGLQKVVQAAGRVIRTREDRGSVLLIDDRFARTEVRALFPAWWEVQSLG